MELQANRILGWKGEKDGQPILLKERVLWIYPDKTVSLIDLSRKRPLPVRRQIKELYDAFVNEDMVILKEDPYTEQYRDEADISDSDKVFREHNWEILEPFLTNKNYLGLLDRKTRGPVVIQIMKKSGWTKETVYKYLRRFWLAGQTKNALLPNFRNCGGRGGRRLNNKHRPGRKRKKHKLGWTEGNGVPVDDDIRERLMAGVKEFHVKKKLPFPKAFEKTIQTRFHNDFEEVNGIIRPKLWDPTKLPSERQARYLFHREPKDPTKLIIAQKGKNAFLANNRALLGETLSMTDGPGSLYVIDASVGDIYLRSDLDRNRLIGRPVIYLVVDVFTRMIVGFAVLLEGPSWMGAMQALFNAFTNKPRFCAELGITITHSQWPCEGLPEAILADGGELLGYNANSLAALGVPIHQAAAWRPDWKSLVERYFGLVHTHIEWVPGKLHKREPGEHDCRLDGLLTPNMLRQLLTWVILKHNKCRLLKKYPLSKDMIADGVKRYPNHLWHWGVKESLSELRWKPEPLIQATLLPRGEATVTRRGIRFKNLFYTCSVADKEQWFIRASQGTWKVPVAYYPPNDSVLYLRLQDGHQLVPCTLVDRVNEQTWIGKDWYDVEDHFALRSLENVEAKYTAAHDTLEFDVQEQALITQAQKELDHVQITQPKSTQLNGIAENYKQECATEREQCPPIPASQKPAPPVSRAPIDEEYIPEDSPFDLLSEVQELVSHSKAS